METSLFVGHLDALVGHFEVFVGNLSVCWTLGCFRWRLTLVGWTPSGFRWTLDLVGWTTLKIVTCNKQQRIIHPIV